jgi:hypothetical protein
MIGPGTGTHPAFRTRLRARTDCRQGLATYAAPNQRVRRSDASHMPTDVPEERENS